MERTYLILSAIGSDRPGLVKQLAAIIHQNNCNIEDSRMAILAGEFALILLYSGAPQAVEDARKEALQRLRDQLGFVVSFKQAASPSDKVGHLPRRLSLSGSDQPGIVHRVSEVLAQLDINVATLESHLSRAAFSGTPIFSLNAEIQVPGAAALRGLRSALDQVCDELDLAYAIEACDVA